MLVAEGLIWMLQQTSTLTPHIYIFDVMGLGLICLGDAITAIIRLVGRPVERFLCLPSEDRRQRVQSCKVYQVCVLRYVHT